MFIAIVTDDERIPGEADESQLPVSGLAPAGKTYMQFCSFLPVYSFKKLIRPPSVSWDDLKFYP